jgi:ADP-ribose pyrophosphatase YjhB (NUDIX family)
MAKIMEMTGSLWKVMPRGMRAFVTRRVQPTFTCSAAGIITNENGEVLLLDHVLRPASGWGIAGGFLDRGEQAEAALRREISEETGLELTNIKLYRVRTLKRHIEVIFTASSTGTPGVNSGEIREARWFRVSEMPGEMSLQQQFMIRAALETEDNA